MLITPYNAFHKQEVIDLILHIQQNEFNITITLDSQPDLQDINGFYRKGQGNFWVAIENEKIIGTISLLDIGNHQTALRKMFVHAAYRGKAYGVSKQLLDVAFNWARDKQMKSIYLGTTEKFLAAHRFYEKNGFQEIERNQLPLQFPVMEVDTKFYYYIVTT